MALLSRIPPGRAGRLWLHRRLATAERGREQLDRKLRILLPELERGRTQSDLRREQWTATCSHAQVWLLRAVLLGGQDVLRHGPAEAPAHVAITWTTSMGLRYPAGADVVRAPDTAPSSPGNAAMTPARAAFRTALDAGVRAAAAADAVRRLEAEIAVTRRRLRALEERWLPALRAALAALELSLAQAEQEDGMRLRRARPAPGSRTEGALP